VQLFDAAGEGARKFDDGLLGLQVHDDLFGLDGVSGFDADLGDIGCFDPFANGGELELDAITAGRLRRLGRWPGWGLLFGGLG
jgi:hypothetical protein